MIDKHLKLIKLLTEPDAIKITRDNLDQYITDKRIELDGIEFKSTLILDGSEFDSSSDYLLKEIRIRGCQNVSLLLHEFNVGGISISNSEIANVIIKTSVVGVSGIQIRDSEFKKEIGSIENLRISESSRINGIVFLENINKLNNFIIEKCKCILDENVFVSTRNELNVRIIHSNIERLLINSSSLSNGIKIASSKVNNYFTNNSLSYSVSLIESIIGVLDFEEVKLSSYLKFAESFVGNGLIKRTDIYKLIFEKSLRINSFILFEDLYVFKIDFTHHVNLGKIIFKEINKREIDNTFLPALDMNKVITVKYTDIGDVQFYNCKLEKDWMFDVGYSNVLGSYLVGTRLPSKGVHKDADSIRQLGLLYGQLQKVSEKNGNRVGAIRYQSLSQQVYLKYLLHKKISYRTLSDIFSLSLNLISNDFNYKLNRAFLFFLFISFSFFFLYVYSLDKYYFSIRADVDWEIVKYTLTFFFEFINPTHRSEFILDYYNPQEYITITPAARFFDGLSRIFISYAIFQFIQSFRKFGKSE